MSKISGIVICHFSSASDLHPGERDIRVTIDDFRVPLSTVLDKLWASRNIQPSQVAGCDVLVFLTDGSGLAVYPTITSTGGILTETELAQRQREFKVKAIPRESMIKNYSQLEIVCSKLSFEKQRARDEAEEEEELLRMLEEESGRAKPQVQQQQQQQPQIQVQQQQQKQQQPVVVNTAADELRRKANLCSFNFPLNISDPSSSSSIATNGNCLLCRCSLRPHKNSKNKNNNSSKNVLTTICGNYSCFELSCESCYEYCFSLLLSGNRCPVCGRNSPRAPAQMTSQAQVTSAAQGTSAVVASAAPPKKEDEKEGETATTTTTASAVTSSSSSSSSGVAAGARGVTDQEQQQQQHHQKQQKKQAQDDDVIFDANPRKIRRVE